MTLLKRFAILLFVPLSMLFSCTKNDSSTIILLGTESYVDDILDVIPDSLVNTFVQYFGAIPRGYVPPNIEGSFVVTPKQRCYSNVPNWPMSIIEPNMNLSLTNQHNSVVEISLIEANETFTDTVYVIGHDNEFTVYYQENKLIDLVENEAQMKRGIIIKGKMGSDGIKDFMFASIIMEVKGDLYGVLAQRGQFFIYKDGDGLARKEEP